MPLAEAEADPDTKSDFVSTIVKGTTMQKEKKKKQNFEPLSNFERFSNIKAFVKRTDPVTV